MPRQRDVLCQVMLSAGECGVWLTLRELSRMTRFGEASISAQLRHLRKPEYGAFVVEKRRREADEVVREEPGAVWEYRLSRGMPQTCADAPKPAGSRCLALQMAH